MSVATEQTASHWQTIFRTSDEASVSWYQRRPAVALRLIVSTVPRYGSVIDIGAGTSTLVDELLDDGWSDITVLDVSSVALTRVRQRLAGRPGISYVVANLLVWEPDRRFDAWHDRAVFHFLVSPEDQQRYVETVRASVRPGGAVIMGVFAEDGPTGCSGLPTARYSARQLADVFGRGFVVQHAEREEHLTPSGSTQQFTWVVLRRQGSGGGPSTIRRTPETPVPPSPGVDRIRL